ncbi:MAG: ribonuclease H-like domain-containing protein [Promethearchaeota archaeon]|nr:MAG: ribonuclease H-like domain-containing protein [Candidatus Lokiarchaeota archaeon]
MDNYKFESFDITPLVEKYHGQRLEDLYQNHRIIKNHMGEFIEFFWEEEDIPNDINLFKTQKKMLYNLKTVSYIGDFIEKKLKQRGIRTLIDLKYHLNYSSPAKQILNLIKKKDYRTLVTNRYVTDLDLSFCFKIEEFLFIDIETLGIIDNPVILVGIGFFEGKKFKIHLFFARELEEEIAIYEHLRTKIFPYFRCFITYNGKTFDIPYLANRFLYFFDENPMISEKDQPYEICNTKFHHIDLYHHCRRMYKGQYNNFSLTTMEEKLLKWTRDNTLPSNLVGLCYRKYKEKPKRYIGLIKEVIEHNYYDIYSMPLILKILLA